MRRFPIHADYDITRGPIGWVEIDEDVSEELLGECAIAPALVKRPGEEVFRVDSFGLVARENVDTRPRNIRY